MGSEAQWRAPAVACPFRQHTSRVRRPAPIHRGMPMAARSADGRLWFVTQTDLVILDPKNISHPKPPKLSIETIAVEGTPLAESRKIPPHPQNMTVEYFGLTLTEPEKVAYRTRLVGAEERWQDVDDNTTANYSELGPGTYVFQVVASTGNGLWTAPISSAPFTVLPGFYQTWWFLLLCIALLVTLLVLFFSLRLRYIALMILDRADERANERVRIARDLHDTLLQSVQAF
jgi:hypothetical protein